MEVIDDSLKKVILNVHFGKESLTSKGCSSHHDCYPPANQSQLDHGIEWLEDVDKWSKCVLIAGFIREIEQSTNDLFVIPKVIIFLCLSYSTDIYFKDCFESARDDIFTISDDKLTIKNVNGATWNNHTIFCKEAINSTVDNIYRWVLDIHAEAC